MALAPLGNGEGFRDSIKSFPPSSIDDKLEQPQLSKEELQEWGSFGQEAAAEFAAKEAKEVEDWAGETFPLITGYTPAKLDELEDRLRAYERGSSIIRIRRRGGSQKYEQDPFEEEGDIEKRIR